MKYFQLFIIVFAQSLFAQPELKCDIEAKNLTPNDFFRVDFVLNQLEDDFTAPDFKKSGLEFIYGPTVTQTQTYNNGVRTYSKIFSYVLKATKIGTFTIGRATMKIDEKTYKSEPVSVSVNSLVKDEAFYNDFYFVAETNKESDFCYTVTEPIIVTYKLYYNKNLKITSREILNDPKFNNFQIKRFIYNNPNSTEQLFKGKSYNVFVANRVIVYPDELGKFEFDSIGVKVKIKKSDKIIAGKKPTFTTIERKTFSNKPKVNVCNKLPEDAPKSYSGAYGNFEIKLIKPIKEPIANQPFDVKIEISGEGNFDAFKFPDLEYITSVVESNIDLKTLKTDVKIDNKDQIGAKFGILAKQTKTVTLKSAVKGKQTILPIAFTFFNPDSRSYQTVTTEEVVLEIK